MEQGRAGGYAGDAPSSSPRAPHLQAEDKERARAWRGLDALGGHGDVASAVVVVGLVQHLVQPLDDVGDARHDDRGVRARISRRARPSSPGIPAAAATERSCVRIVVKRQRLRRGRKRRLRLLPRGGRALLLLLLLPLQLLLLALASDLCLELLALARESSELALALVPRHRAPTSVLRYLERQGGGASDSVPLALPPVNRPRGRGRGQCAGQLRSSRGRGHRVLVCLLLLIAMVDIQWPRSRCCC